MANGSGTSPIDNHVIPIVMIMRAAKNNTLFTVIRQSSLMVLVITNLIRIPLKNISEIVEMQNIEMANFMPFKAMFFFS